MPAGDIAVLPKLADVGTGDTLSESGKITFAEMPFPDPLYPVAIESATKGEEDKLGTALNKLVEEEPTLHLRRDDETHQTVLSGLGDVHIDVALAKLRDKYNVEAQTIDLRIPYRETIRKKARGAGTPQEADGRLGPVRRLLACASSPTPARATSSSTRSWAVASRASSYRPSTRASRTR